MFHYANLGSIPTPVGFMRVPKNAGTSAYRMLAYAAGIIRDRSYLQLMDTVTDLFADDPMRKPFPEDQALIDNPTPLGCAVAFLRDPVDRFLSTYTNRILHHRKAPAIPFLDFLDHFPRYLKTYPDLRHHFVPQTEVLGDLSRYTYLLRVTDLHRWAELLTLHSGRETPVIRHQTGGSELKPTLPRNHPDLRRLLAEYYSADLAAWQTLQNLSPDPATHTAE